MKQRTSLYFEEEELELIERAKQRWQRDSAKHG